MLTLRTHEAITEVISDLREHIHNEVRLADIKRGTIQEFDIPTASMVISKDELMMVIESRLKGVETRLANKNIAVRLGDEACST